MSIVTTAIEELAEENGLCIAEKDGHIKVYDMEHPAEPIIAWYYAGCLHEALNEAIIEPLPMFIQDSEACEKLVDTILDLLER